ncbi:hypothetical protein D3C78_1279090 [compost metagenome]
MALRQIRQTLLQPRQLGQQGLQGFAGQQGLGGVHHVLGGRAPVQPIQAFGPVGAQPLLHRLQHGQPHGTAAARARHQRLAVHRRGGAGLGDGLGRRLRNQSAFGLGQGQCRLEAQHGVLPLCIGEQRVCILRTQVIVHQGHIQTTQTEAPEALITASHLTLSCWILRA